jgi:hypothetical protein
MDIHEEAQWHDKAHKEAREAIEKWGGNVLDNYTPASNIIAFADGGNIYYLEFEVSKCVTTSLPKLVWMLHKELGRSETAWGVLRERLR